MYKQVIRHTIFTNHTILSYPKDSKIVYKLLCIHHHLQIHTVLSHPKIESFKDLYKLLHTHRLLQIHTVLSHPKIESFKDFVQALAHPLPFTNPHSTLIPKDPKIQRLCTRSHASATFYKFTLYLLLSGSRGAAVCDGSWHPDVLASRYLKNLHNGLTSSSGGMWGYYKK